MATDSIPTVSVVTPSFNQGAYIQSTIRSVLSQDYPRIEYLVMDAASTDNTLDLLRKYSGERPDRMRFVSEKDRGQSHALNKAVAQTSGEIIGWLNSDDTYEPGAIAAAVECFRQHPDVDLIYGDANFTDPQDRVLARCTHIEPYNWHRFVHYSDFIVQPAAFFTRRAFEAVGGADESLHYVMDYDLFLKMASKFKVAYLPRVLANYKWFGQNKTAVGGWDRLNEMRRVAMAFGARGLPAYGRLEAARLGVSLAIGELRHAHITRAARQFATGAAPFLTSPRAWRSLVSPACWRIIWTGQVLRRANRLTK
ncbi:MAG TPA: glycosyltransferase family 2 protein [Tepidisphaeraceae bacterium]|nr:glycosyltransferase family 2 protein [Tepidisphaeraceae bacterium]